MRLDDIGCLMRLIPRFRFRKDFFNKLRRLILRPAKKATLSDLLCQDMAGTSLAEKMYWVEQILHWLSRETTDSSDARFRFFLSTLDKNPEWKKHFERTVSVILAEGRFLGLFSQVGLAVDHGLWGDTMNRFIRKLLPAGGSTDFREMLLNALSTEEHIGQIDAISDEILLGMRDLICIPENAHVWNDLRGEAREALLFLCTHVAHYGLSADIRRRLPRTDKISASPFYKLGQAVLSEERQATESALLECGRSVEAVYKSLEETGVSVDAVNRLETLSAMLEQIGRITALNQPAPALVKAREIVEFLTIAITSGLRGRAVLGHVRRHFYLLSRKIVERNGQSGEHYIARTGAELALLFRSAIGGGFIVVLMTVLKTTIILSEPAPLFLATGIWIVYAWGFLAMQFTGTTLATKIPSFTASRLAGLLRTVRRRDAETFRGELRLVIRSQTIALVGNVAGVVTLALLLDYLHGLWTGGAGLMPEHYAQHVLSGLHPVISFALPLGALTGLELWLSSMVGGWFENWVVFNRLPEAIEFHFHIRKFFGDSVARRFSGWTLRHSSGIATNVSLGFLFGFVPLMGAMLGLNWNGNHVTISTAGAVFAAASVHYYFSVADALWVVLGLGLIGVLNFMVSFGLALMVAGNSQKMQVWRVLYYLRAGVGRRRRRAKA